MKKIYKLMILLLLMVILLTGCSSISKNPDDKKKIVCTIFPEYDWLMNILGDESDEYNVSLILDGETDLHSYQPTAEDLAAVLTCDMLIYVGGESDEWIEDALKNKVNKSMTVVNLMDILGTCALDEETVEGMTDNHHDESDKDEHVWLSLKNAQLFVDNITEEVVKMDSLNENKYRENCDTYQKQLIELDEEYEEFFSNSENNYTLVVADRFPFLYMAKEYDIEYYAAFSGCSAESEAGFSTITYLAKKINEENVNRLFILENSDERLADTIIGASGRNLELGVLDSLQSVSAEERKNGYSYIGAMKANLDELRG